MGGGKDNEQNFWPYLAKKQLWRCRCDEGGDGGQEVANYDERAPWMASPVGGQATDLP